MDNKLKSRKFWISVAAMLGSFSTSIAGIVSANDTVATAGVVCGILSAGIYAFCEAYVDASAIEKNDNE